MRDYGKHDYCSGWRDVLSVSTDAGNLDVIVMEAYRIRIAPSMCRITQSKMDAYSPFRPTRLTGLAGQPHEGIPMYTDVRRFASLTLCFCAKIVRRAP